MKIKLLLKNVGIIFITNLLMGCVSQLTYSDAFAFDSQSSKTEIQGLQETTNTGKFISLQQKYMYEILVAEIARLRGNNTLSAKYFLKLAIQISDPDLAENATMAALYAKQYDIATKAAKLWVTLAPNDPYARQILGRMLLHQQRADEAVVHLEAMIDSLKDKPARLSSLIATLLEQHPDKTQALEFMEKLVAKRPNNSVLLLTYSRFLSSINELGKSVDVLRTFLNQVPDHPEAVPLYAYLLEKQGKLSEALQWQKQVLQQFPNKREWRLMYARMLADAEQFEEAIKQFQLLLSNSSQSNGDILYALGILSLQVDKSSAAKSYFKALFEKGERRNTALYYLGQIVQEEKNFIEAIFWYKQIDGGSHYLNAQARIALILADQGNLDQAVEHLRSLPVERPKDTINMRLLEAELLIEKKLYQQAMATYDSTLKLAPDNTEVLYMRGMLAEKMGNIAQLEQDLRRIIELEPKNADALNALGYSLIEHTDRYQDGYELIKLALELSPTDFYILDSMGWVLYKMGKNMEAVAYLRKAQIKQDDPEVAAHLGEVLWSIGDMQAAKEVWEKALVTFPDNDKLREVRHRFLPIKENGEK